MVAGRGWNLVCYRVMLSCVVRLLLLSASSFVCRLVLSGGDCASLFVCRLVLSGELLSLSVVIERRVVPVVGSVLTAARTLFAVCCLCLCVGCCLACLVYVFPLFCRLLSGVRRVDYSCARLSGVVVVVHVARCVLSAGCCVMRCVLSAEHSGVCCSLCRCK